MTQDNKLVNFAEDYELNNRLRRHGKRQTRENREALREIGDATKKQLGKARLTHDDLDKAIEKKANKLD